MRLSLEADFNLTTLGGACGICQMPRREGDRVVCTDVDVPLGLGTIDICTTCVGLLAHTAGLLAADEQAMLNAELVRTSAALAVALKERDEARESRAKYEAARSAFTLAMAEVNGATRRPAKAGA